jgi:thiol-disulfide isomerase/thioredoxin
MRKLSVSIPLSIAGLCLFATGVATIAAQEPAANTSAATLSAAKPQAAEPDPTTNPKYLSAMAEGKKLEHERQYVFAIDAYKKANKIAGGKDRSSLRKVFDLQMKTGGYKDAIATAAAMESIAQNPTEKSIAESDRGRAILAETGDKNKVEKLQAADAAFKAAVADAPKNATALYMDGIVLARLNQMDAARERFKACASCIGPNDPSYVRAKHFAENPALSTAKMAPAFTVVALDGTKFNLDEMGGRVVLIDFWATWCGPCNEELPHLKKIAKEFAGEPLVMISVSDDKDETKWKDFIAKHEMTWVQYRDADGTLGKEFAVQSIPHYFTIDADGVLTAEMMGSGSDVEGRLKKLIAKAKAAGAKPVSVASGAK